MYGWLDKIVVEQYQAQDFYDWCVGQGYEAEFMPASSKNQDALYTEFYQLVNQGYFKSPKVPYYTDEDGNLYQGYTTKEDILREEMEIFTCDIYRNQKTKWWGSPEKKHKGGIKDDVVFSIAWGIYATQGEMVPMGNRGSKMTMPKAIINKDVVGEYDT
jgi:hypothetical protein